MGTWGTGCFQNDTAMDFVSEVESAPDASILLEALEAVVDVDEDDSPDADISAQGLVAAEFVAAALGKPAKDFSHPERSDGSILPWPWRPTGDDVATCEAAVRRIAEDSELSELWCDSEDGGDEWAEVIDDLLIRLGRPGL